MKLRSIVIGCGLIMLLVGALFALGKGNARARETISPWPRGELRIIDKTGHTAPVQGAVESINSIGLSTRLKVVESGWQRSRNHDQVIIRKVDDRDIQAKCSGCFGFASSIGYRGGSEEILISDRPVHDADLQQLLIHEIGHILGLSHNDQDCSTMNSDFFFTNCLQSKEGWFRYGLQASDINRLLSIGYEREKMSYIPWRPIQSASKAPTVITKNNLEVNHP